MSAFLHAELLKLRTTRTFAALVGAAVVLSLLVVVLITSIDDGFSREDARDVLTADASAFFVLLLGAIGITGEWRHRTITSSLLAAPDRIRFLAAKLLAYAAAGAVLSLVVTLVIAAVSSLILAGRGETTVALSDVGDVLWRNVLTAALLGALGVAIGSVLRNQIGAIITILVLSFVVEPTVFGVEPEVGAYLPLSGLPAGITQGPAGFGEGSSEVLSPGTAVALELAWVAAIAAVGGLLLRRRDL